MEVYLSFFKRYIFGGWFNYIYLSVLVLLLLINVLYFTVKRFKFWHKKLLNFTILALFTLTFGEFLTVSTAFNSLAVCFTIFCSIVLAQSFVCCFLYPLKGSKQKREKAKPAEIKSDYGYSVKRAVERIKMTEDPPQVFSGYVDVGYIKTLINNLKSNDLTESDIRDLDEFEVYLLNFVNRQPTNAERQNLSTKLGALIKKLAKYA